MKSNIKHPKQEEEEEEKEEEKDDFAHLKKDASTTCPNEPASTTNSSTIPLPPSKPDRQQALHSGSSTSQPGSYSKGSAEVGAVIPVARHRWIQQSEKPGDKLHPPRSPQEAEIERNKLEAFVTEEVSSASADERGDQEEEENREEPNEVVESTTCDSANLLDVQPGAFHMNPAGMNERNHDDNEEGRRREASNRGLPRPTSSSAPHLLTAQLVDEEELLQQAREEGRREILQQAVSAVVVSVGDGDNKNILHQPQQRRCLRWSLLVTLLLVVVVVIVVGVIVGTRTSSSTSSTDGPAVSPSPVNGTTPTGPVAPSPGNATNGTDDDAVNDDEDNTTKRIFGPWNQVGKTLLQSPWADEALSLSGDGKVLAVGHAESGTVNVYEWDDALGDWQHRGINETYDDYDNPSDNFGWAVSLSSTGSRLISGAPGGISESTGPGFVRLYDYLETGMWVPYPDIPGLGSGSFGHSVALSADGQTFVAGGPGYAADESTTDMGYAQAYRFSNASGEWLQVGQDLYGMSAGDRFGEAVDISDDGSVVASAGFGNNNNLRGMVQVFEYNVESGEWEQWGQTLFGDEEEDRFGWDVALSGTGTVMAASGGVFSPRNQVGYVRVFRYDNNDESGGNWTQMGQDLFGDPGERYGYTIALSHDGNTLICGVPSRIVNGSSEVGAAQVFTYESESDRWTQLGPDAIGLQITDGANNYGQAVGLSSDGSIFAASSRSRNNDTGYTEVFQLDLTLPQ